MLLNLDYCVFQDREIYPVVREGDAPLCTHHRDLADIYTAIIPDFAISGGTAVWMADFLGAAEVIVCGCDSYTADRRYWHSKPGTPAGTDGYNSLDVWRRVRDHLQHPERVSVTGPLTEVFHAS